MQLMRQIDELYLAMPYLGSRRIAVKLSQTGQVVNRICARLAPLQHIRQYLLERLWRTLKYEEVYLHEYVTPKDAFHGLTRYFHFYNQQRLHQSLGYRTPAAVHRDTQGGR